MILTVTYNPAVDQTVRFDEALESGAVNRATGARYDPGGKGINVSQYLDGLGTETVATGVLGGFTGEYVRESLSEDGVTAEFVDVGEPTRLNTTALAADGEYKLNQSGPRVSPDAVDALLEVLGDRNPDRIHVAGSLPPGLDDEAIDAVAAAGDWRASVDVTGDLLAALDDEYALCAPNRSELGAATGAAVSTVERCADAADSLRGAGFERVLASLGADGALLVDSGGVRFAEALDVDVVDTVGAGDALVSGYLAAVDAGERPETALRTGVAAAARVVNRSGTSVPDFDDVDELRASVTVRRV